MLTKTKKPDLAKWFEESYYKLIVNEDFRNNLRIYRGHGEYLGIGMHRDDPGRILLHIDNNGKTIKICYFCEVEGHDEPKSEYSQMLKHKESQTQDVLARATSDLASVIKSY